MNFNGIAKSKRDVVMAMSRDPLFFMKTVAPHLCKDEAGNTIPFGAVHRAMMYDLPDTYKDNTNPNRKEITMIQLPRGYAKSTIVTIIWALWQAIFRNKHHIPISSVIEDTSKGFLETIASLVESDSFKFYFGDCVGGTWNKYERVLENKSIGLHCRIASYGVEQSVVGLNWLGHRPDVWIFDDIENLDTVQSIKIIEAREQWIYAVVLPALQGAHCPIIFIGTPFSNDCVITRVEANKGMCKVIKYPALVENERQARKLKVPVGHSIWEEKKSTASVIEERDKWEKAGKLNEWNLANMLRASAAKVRGFETIIDYEPEELLNKDLAVYILCDFAYSRKATADPAAIAVWGIDTSPKNKMYDLDGEEGKWGDTNAILKLSKLIEKWHKIGTEGDKRLTVAIESNSFDMIKKLLYDSLAMLDMRKVSVIQLQHCNRSKISRMKAFIPYCDIGRALFRKDNAILKEQMKRFDGTSDRFFNSLDASAYILDFLFQREPKKTYEEERHEAWIDLTEYIDSMTNQEEEGLQIVGAMDDDWF